MTPLTPFQRALVAAKDALVNDPGTTAWMDADNDPDEFTIDGEIRLSPVVRAVLQALREPSPAMIEAGAEDSGIDGHVNEFDPAVPWQAMINAALSE